MKKYLLDTDISSWLIRDNDPGLREKFAANFTKSSISAITVAELQFGAQKRKARSLTDKVNAFCRLLPVVDWTFETAVQYGRIRAAMEAAGTPLAAMDMLIAAAALAGDAILVTNNTAHFSRVPGLKIENWTS